MHSKRDNKEIMINNKAVVEKLFQSLVSGYQNNLETSVGDYFIFDYVHLLYYKCHKISST